MKVELYYIQGINSVDTPYFASQAEQRTYMESKLITTIDTAFYPPHYLNTIRIDSDDATFNTGINYLGLQYLGKWYYYFIRHIEYSSEDVIELDINMDVIQTYMFNIKFNSALIERKFINRYKYDGSSHSYIINREDYIRENISHANLVPKAKTYAYSDNVYFKIYVLSKKRTGTTSGDKMSTFHCKVTALQRTYDVPYLFIFQPININSYSIDGVTITNVYDTGGFISEVLKALSPYIVDSFVICGVPDVGFTLTYTGQNTLVLDTSRVCALNVLSSSIGSFIPMNMRTYTSSDYIYPLFTVCSDKPALDSPLSDYQLSYELRVQSYSTEITISKSRNTSLNYYFGSTFVPALLDEQYETITFGNDYSTTGFPLYKVYSLSTTFSLSYTPNCVTGMAIFSVNFRYSYDNNYSTYIIDANKCYGDIIVDSANEWLLNNHSRLISSTLQLGVNTTRYVVSSIAGVFAGGMTNTSSFLNNPANRDFRYMSKTDSSHFRNLPLKKSALSQYEESNETDYAGNSSNTFVDLALGMNQVRQDVIQSGMLPNDVKQTGNASDKIFSDTWRPFYKVMKVADYEECAWYYHINGYLVNEFKNDTNIFDYVNTRYYYNFVKLKQVNLNIINAIETEEIVNRITSRLCNGIRLWNNTSISIGDFTYDNVEKAYL